MPRAAALRDVQAVRPGRGRGNVPAGTPGQRNTSSASTPFARSVAWSASASAVVNRTPVSTPAGTRWRHLDPPPAVADRDGSDPTMSQWTGENAPSKGTSATTHRIELQRVQHHLRAELDDVERRKMLRKYRL
jgi:hypothetical protein